VAHIRGVKSKFGCTVSGVGIIGRPPVMLVAVPGRKLFESGPPILAA
jgi:hypothetical protein